MVIKSAGKTDIGLVRQINEDSFRLVPDRQLFIVCDGMGGHSAGEVASAMACDTIAALYANFHDELLKDERLRLPRMLPPSTDVLTKSVRIANHSIYRRAAENPSMAGMGTTIVAIAFEEDIVTLLHVGDSRIYRFFNNKLYPLTVDHSWAAELEKNENLSSAEARQMVNRNVITRALGVKEAVQIDVGVRKVVEGEIYILCSDGLCGFVDDGDIRDVAVGCKGDISRICGELVRVANERGGADNVTVVAAEVTGKIESSQLNELETVTVDEEHPDYYIIEDEWAAKASEKIEESEPDTEETIMVETPRRGYGFIFGIIAIIALAIIFYFIFKG